MIDAFLLSFAINFALINYQKLRSVGQIERELGLRSHKVKNHTPTLGGIGFIITTFLLFTLSFSLNRFAFKLYLLLIIPLLGYGVLGFIDDYLILKRGKNDGINASLKFLFQLLIAGGYFAIYLAYQFDTTINFYLFKIDLKFLYGIFIMLAFSGFSNATNLTDGIDGLLATTFVVVLLGYSLINKSLIINQYIAILIASILGFLVLNLPKAKIFMGNTGALSLGSVMVSIAIIIKKELSLFVFGFLYILEVLSVIMQVTYFKISKGKRIFKMAPLHHHFELVFNSETKTLRLMIIVQVIITLLGIVLFKHFL